MTSVQPVLRTVMGGNQIRRLSVLPVWTTSKAAHCAKKVWIPMIRL